MALVWDDSLLLGLEEVDLQHKSIFEQFARFSEAIQEGSPEDILQEMVVFLSEYAQFHFATEEKIMAEYDYPKLEEQRREHADFSRTVKAFRSRVEQEGVSHDMAIDMNGKLFRWVALHIRSHDREMVDYVRERENDVTAKIRPTRTSGGGYLVIWCVTVG